MSESHLPPSHVSTGRHIRLIENSNDPLSSLRSQDIDSDLYHSPKFLGFCCGPAVSSCCGCTLQFSLKTFATIALVFGGLGLMGSLVSIGLSDVATSIESLIKYGLLLAFGVLLWSTASEMNPKTGKLSSYIFAGIYIIDVITITIAVITMASPAFKNQVIEGIRKEYFNEHHRYPTEDEMATIQLTANTMVRVLVGSTVTLTVLEGLIFLFVYYFIWSFIVRAKRGELFLLSHGASALPVNQLYGVYYPQMQQPSREVRNAYEVPVIAENSLSIYAQEQRPQFQLSDMQQMLPQAQQSQFSSLQEKNLSSSSVPV